MQWIGFYCGIYQALSGYNQRTGGRSWEYDEPTSFDAVCCVG